MRILLSDLNAKLGRENVLIWDKEELPQEWKESITVPVHKKGDRIDCNNYRGISLLSTSYKIIVIVSF